MKITKAIEILNWENSQFPRGVNPDFTDALQLGSEALQHFEQWRKYTYHAKRPVLPSEEPE